MRVQVYSLALVAVASFAVVSTTNAATVPFSASDFSTITDANFGGGHYVSEVTDPTVANSVDITGTFGPDQGGYTQFAFRKGYTPSVDFSAYSDITFTLTGIAGSFSGGNIFVSSGPSATFASGSGVYTNPATVTFSLSTATNSAQVANFGVSVIGSAAAANTAATYRLTFTPAATPEPASLSLLGLAGLGALRRRRV